ncbi:hypothetical protein GCM10023188_48370 [Pontibacter saemangeumensis]|uniref:Uncharacterized protein n=2 Tax=Pontibacter saemangeumensis TaxID=1084525 RepID=A0ABP8M8Q8_9BACT
MILLDFYSTTSTMKTNTPFLKTNLLFSFLCLVLLQAVQAQDTITKRSGESVQAKVLEITPGEVKYKRFDLLEGPTYSVAKADVLLIQYENKTTEVFELASSEPADVTASTQAAPPVATGANLYGQGQMDAGNYYQGYKGASTGTLAVSLLSPLVGLIPAIACSSTTPKDKNLDYPSHERMQNPDYVNGYKQSSRKIKSRKVWTNWGVALGVNIALVYMLSQ